MFDMIDGNFFSFFRSSLKKQSKRLIKDFAFRTGECQRKPRIVLFFVRGSDVFVLSG